MTKQQARQWKKRWALVNEKERELLRATPIEEKLRQVAALMASVDELGWREALSEGDLEVWDRWVRLREALGG